MEKAIIESLHDSELGREGMIPYEMLSYEGRAAVDKLVERGEIIIVKNPIVDIGSVIRLPHEVYPETFGELMMMRNDNASWLLIKEERIKQLEK